MFKYAGSMNVGDLKTGRDVRRGGSMEKRMAVTQKDLAKLAGVGLTTVYNALYNKDLVHPDTRERINQLMREYDYQPNGIARAMVRGKTQVIGILVPRIDVLYYSEIVSACERALKIGGYTSIICQHMDDTLEEEREVGMLRERRVDGMIVRVAGRREDGKLYDRLMKSGVPFVLIDRGVEGLESHFVGTDGCANSREITEFLIKKGHRRIAAAVWTEYRGSLGDKFFGYKAALEKHGIEFDERLVMLLNSEYYGGREETIEMMRRVGNDKPTAILSLNDTSVVGVVQALTELGMVIPDDVAVANIGGYAERTLGALSRFKLTSSVADCEVIGREAARMLISQIDGKDWRKGPIMCPSQLRIGNST